MKTICFSHITALSVLVLVEWLIFVPAVSAEPLNGQEFAVLKGEEQLKFLKESLLEFRRKCQNISASTRLKVQKRAYDRKTQSMGEKVFYEGYTYTDSVARIDDSYRVWHHQVPQKKIRMSYTQSARNRFLPNPEL